MTDKFDTRAVREIAEAIVSHKAGSWSRENANLLAHFALDALAVLDGATTDYPVVNITKLTAFREKWP